jgi:hypothetical protein
MLPRRRRNSPCRRGLSFSENRILGVHLPIKIGAGFFDSCIVFIFILGRWFRSRHDQVLGGHVQILMHVSNDLGVTSVAGFIGPPATDTPADPDFSSCHSLRALCMAGSNILHDCIVHDLHALVKRLRLHRTRFIMFSYGTERYGAPPQTRGFGRYPLGT